MEMTDQPAAFFSYTSFDNENDDGAIVALCGDLTNEVRVQTGCNFHIFLDRKDINWGQQWGERIDEELASTTFFIPILTPGFFSSQYCIEEVKKFLTYEENMGRKDLMLPLVYVAPGGSGRNISYGHELEQSIFDHQYVDWTEFRFSDISSMSRKRALARLALQIREAIARTNNLRADRDNGEVYSVPRALRNDIESESYGFLKIEGCDRANPDPRQLLRMAMQAKQQGKYQEAKVHHDELVTRQIDWEKFPGLFVDLAYFSISLCDKLEDWQRLADLDLLFFKPHFENLKSYAADSAVGSMAMMYEASMALAMLRQTRLEKARTRIEVALARPPKRDARPEHQILYANAHVTRALIDLTEYVLRGEAVELHFEALEDLNTAESLYRRHAHMGNPRELHHLGRFYGTRAFFRVIESKASSGVEMQFDPEIFDDARKAHEGANRTQYGRIAGKYCHAYCLFEYALSGLDDQKRNQHLTEASDLLSQALNGLDYSVSLARYKVAKLRATVLAILDGDLEEELSKMQVECQKTMETLQARRFPGMKNIGKIEWLFTPLN